ncbi:MAG: phenylpyruvate tautomerase MIF-related protein [cyanobacterium endosymbiont of Rhopalodia musculus]|uniref:phenylpyruvate tautomerase MIF-related protein n=1 Tax=cyanobacterium endosymbiont of Epithemia clementina EcSB TaxID=3034674 RepID=UPI00247FF86D|nr:phenylpyruvate tautomerase MIF-related protein [cyanobacterium endosymbiont of Epithemia clementina EcSB]WGT66711.1 phenylpyruvate tautomerase MIF-related protein [cyanobacterium endosymbiont of Epithemia clementina EcSB]
MPLIKIKTSVAETNSSIVESLLTSLSFKMAKHFGKPESYVMTAFEPDVQMTFGGTFDPVCYVEIKNIGKMTPEQTKSISKDFCQEIKDKLGVPTNRIYIEFTDAERSMWGWNGGTF